MTNNFEPGVQQRFEELEVKLSFQEQTISELNDVITAQSQRLTVLERQLTLLHQRQQAGSNDTSVDAKSEPPPPHY